MNKNYVNGRAREYRIKNEFEKKGFLVVRASGSHSPIDLVAINTKTKEIYFIQSKPKSMSNNRRKVIELLHRDLNDEFIGKFKVISLFKELNLNTQEVNKI